MKKRAAHAERLSWLIAGFVGLLSIWGAPAQAGNIEISVGVSFNRSVYGDPSNYSWTRRWGASMGYQFTEKTEFELSFQESTDRTHIESYEDTTFVDRVYSVNIVQSLVGKTSMFQPYIKAGVGQLNRDATGTYGSGAVPISRVDAVTGVVGGGFRLYFTRTIALRGEGISYLTGGDINTWQDNWATSLGLSVVF